MKRIVAILVCLLLTAVAGFTGNLFGDANGDGEINMSDVMSIVNYTLGSPAPSFDAVAADANDDGKIDMSDAMYIVNRILNKK